MTENVKLSILALLAFIVLVGGIAIPCGITSVERIHSEERIKVAAAEHGCDYYHKEIRCR